MNLAAIQSALRDRNIDAWLFYDHHHRDPIAYRVLGLPEGLMVTRRWFYLIPAQGEPSKLVHKIEAGHLDSLPGSKRQYSGWQELFDSVKALLAAHRDIAMQYSPNNLVFTVSLVDGGTIDLIRGLGKNVVSSADLVAQFEATLSDDQIKNMVKEASEHEAEDKERREQIERRNKLDNLCYTLEKTLTENKEKIPAGDVSTLEGYIKEARSAIEKQDDEGVKAATDKLEKEAHRIAAVMYQSAGPGGPGASPGGPPPSEGGGAGGDGTGGPEKGADKKGGVIDAEFEETS